MNLPPVCGARTRPRLERGASFDRGTPLRPRFFVHRTRSAPVPGSIPSPFNQKIKAPIKGAFYCERETKSSVVALFDELEFIVIIDLEIHRLLFEP